MQPLDLPGLTLEQIVYYVHQLPTTILHDRINDLSPEQIIAIVTALEETKDNEWIVKLKAVIKGIKDYPKIEAVGKALSLQQAREIFAEDWLLDKSEVWKLSPLFVGMSHDVFSHFLRSASPSHLQIFKHEAIAEPLLHHLTVLIHEIAHQMSTHLEHLQQIEVAIEQLNLQDFSKEELGYIMVGINKSREYYKEALEKINKMLTLAWNSSRVDLIDKLSQAKEGCQKFLIHAIGHPRSPRTKPTGLYAKVQAKLNKVFGDPNDPKDIEALEDDEPAIEALAKFSIWYLRDYWDVGLLPKITDPQTLQSLNAEEEVEQKSELLNDVQENLSSLGLSTVADLKKRGIFSRKILQDYINDHKSLLV